MAAAPTQKQPPEELCLYPTPFNHKDIQTGSSLLEFTWWCLFLTCRSEHSQSKLWSQRSLQSQQHEQVNARRPHTISASWHISRGRLKENNKQKANSQHDPPEGDPSSEGFSPQLEESRTFTTALAKLRASPVQSPTPGPAVLPTTALLLHRAGAE